MNKLHCTICGSDRHTQALCPQKTETYMPLPRIVVRYSCHACQTIDREVSVPVRQATEALKAWVETVRFYVYADHIARSPLCASSKCDLKIPAPEGQPIGTPQRQ